MPRGMLGLGVIFVSLAVSGSGNAQSPTPVIPNALLEVSRDFANTVASAPINKSDPFNQGKGRIQISGMQATNLALQLQFLPSPQSAAVDVSINGNTSVFTDAQTKRVHLNLTTRLSYLLRLRITADENGVCATPCGAQPQLDENTLNYVCTNMRFPFGPIVRRGTIGAFNTFKKKIDEKVFEAGEKILAEQFQKNAAEQIAKVNDKYWNELRRPMEKRGVFPQRIRIMTSETQVGVRLLLNDPTGKPNNFSPVPDIHGWPDISLRLEQSILNNATTAMFAGKTFTGEELDKEFTTLTKPLLGEVKTIEQGDQPFSITFAKEKPIEFTFDKGMFKIAIHGSEFTAGNREFDGMDTTATYKIVKTKRGFVLERQGDVTAYPPGFKPGVDTLGAREQFIRRLLERKFGKAFKPKFEVEDLSLPEKLNVEGHLVSTQADSDKGWLVLAWRLVPGPAKKSAISVSDASSKGR